MSGVSGDSESTGILGAITRRIFGSQGYQESKNTDTEETSNLRTDQQGAGSQLKQSGTEPKPGEEISSLGGESDCESPERDLLSSHAIDFTPSVSPASTAAGTPYTHSQSPEMAPPREDTQGLKARSLQQDLDAVSSANAEQFNSADGQSTHVPTRQGLAIKTKPVTPPIASASPTTDIIDGLLGEVVEKRLAGSDTPDHAARTSRLRNGQERISLMEGEKSTEMKVISPELGIQEVKKPPQQMTIASVSPKSQEHGSTIKFSPFSDAKAAEALGDWGEKYQPAAKETATVASLALPETDIPSKGTSFDFAPYIRRSEENLQLIVGEHPGEFELHAPEGRRFSFSTDKIQQAEAYRPHERKFDWPVAEDKDPGLTGGAQSNLHAQSIEKPKALGSELQEVQHDLSKVSLRSGKDTLPDQDAVGSVDLDLAERGLSPRSTNTPTKKRIREPEGPFMEARPKPIQPKYSESDASPGGLRFPHPETDPGKSPIPEEVREEPTVAERLNRDGIEVGDPSGAQSVLTPSDAQIAQAKAMAGGKVDAVTGHSTLQASEIGLPRDSVDLMDGISGATATPTARPTFGDAIPEGSTLGSSTHTANKHSPLPAKIDSPDVNLRVTVPTEGNVGTSSPHIRSKASDSSTATPTQPNFVETPSRIMGSAAEPHGRDQNVDVRHIDSAASNIRKAAEAVGITSMFPILEKESDKLKRQYRPTAPAYSDPSKEASAEKISQPTTAQSQGTYGAFSVSSEREPNVSGITGQSQRSPSASPAPQNVRTAFNQGPVGGGLNVGGSSDPSARGGYTPPASDATQAFNFPQGSNRDVNLVDPQASLGNSAHVPGTSTSNIAPRESTDSAALGSSTQNADPHSRDSTANPTELGHPLQGQSYESMSASPQFSVQALDSRENLSNELHPFSDPLSLHHGTAADKSLMQSLNRPQSASNPTPLSPKSNTIIGTHGPNSGITNDSHQLPSQTQSGHVKEAAILPDDNARQSDYKGQSPSSPLIFGRSGSIEYEAESPSRVTPDSGAPSRVLHEAEAPETVQYEAETEGSVQYEDSPIVFSVSQSGKTGHLQPAKTESESVHAQAEPLSQARQLEYESLNQSASDDRINALSTRPIVYEDVEYEEVFEEPGLKNSEPPLLRPGADQQAERQALEATKFDSRVKSGLDSIEVEPEADIQTAEPPTPHPPQGKASSPFDGSSTSNPAAQLKLRSPRFSLLGQPGSSLQQSIENEDLVTTGSNEFDAYIDSQARADSERHSHEFKHNEGSRPSSNLPVPHQLEGSGDLDQDDAEVGKIISEEEKFDSPTIDEEAAKRLSLKLNSPKAGPQKPLAGQPGGATPRETETGLASIAEASPRSSPATKSMKAAVKIPSTSSPSANPTSGLAEVTRDGVVPQQASSDATGIKEVQELPGRRGRASPGPTVSPSPVKTSAKEKESKSLSPSQRVSPANSRQPSPRSVTNNSPMKTALAAQASNTSSPGSEALSTLPSGPTSQANPNRKSKLGCFACFSGSNKTKD